MSQAAPSDMEASADIAYPTTQPTHADPVSCQDVPAPLSAPLQPHSISESFETTTVDTSTSETSVEQGEGAEPPDERQVIECDQSVSLEPEDAEKDVEVCKTIEKLMTHVHSTRHL